MTSSRGILLLSGGIDSPVAGHVLAKQGIKIIGLHYSLEPFTDSAPEEKARRISDLLGFPKLYVCSIGEALAEMARSCIHRYYFVLSKRLMYRLAETLAGREAGEFLITGESLGQVSSQTLHNLRAIDDSVRIPVLRPLIGWDKVEIVQAAREIGTYDISKGPEVCDVLGPSHPATQAKLEVVVSEERKLDYEDIVERSLETLKLVAPSAIKPSAAEA